MKLIALFSFLIAVVGGFGIGLGAIAWSIYLIVLMVKGTMAASFLSILWCVCLWFIGPLAGWIWGLFWVFVAGFFGLNDK